MWGLWEHEAVGSPAPLLEHEAAKLVHQLSFRDRDEHARLVVVPECSGEVVVRQAVLVRPALAPAQGHLMGTSEAEGPLLLVLPADDSGVTGGVF